MIGPIVKHGSSSATSLTAGWELRDGPHGRDIHPLLIRLTISVSDCLWPGRIAASGECATYLLNSTLPGAVRLKVEGHGVADRERQCIALRLHRTGSGGVARESGEGEQGERRTRNGASEPPDVMTSYEGAGEDRDRHGNRRSSIENSLVGQASPPIHKLLWLCRSASPERIPQ